MNNLIGTDVKLIKNTQKKTVVEICFPQNVWHNKLIMVTFTLTTHEIN